MITVNNIVNCAAVAYSSVKLFCTCKYIDHCLVTVFGIGEGGMGWHIKEGILNTEFMRELEGEEIGSMHVAARGAMWTKNCLEVFTILSSKFGVDVSANDELGVFWYLLKDRTQSFKELFMGSILAGMIDGCGEKGEQFPLHSSPEAVKAVEFQIEAIELAHKITSGSRRNW
jgi:hypothetical protein